MPPTATLRVLGETFEMIMAEIRKTGGFKEERRFITIHSSEKRPDDATDTRSKRAFVFLRTFIGIRLAGPEARRGSQDCDFGLRILLR